MRRCVMAGARVWQDDGGRRWIARPAAEHDDAGGPRAHGATRDSQQQRTQAHAEHQRRLPVAAAAASAHRTRRPTQQGAPHSQHSSHSPRYSANVTSGLEMAYMPSVL